MRIGELAHRLGCPVETIRFWERERLLPKPSRTDGNYRAYEESDFEHLLFVRNCRALDMSLDEIRQLLALRSRPEEHCGQVNELIDHHVEEVVQKIEALRSLEAQLRALRRQCDENREIEQCGILRGLTDGDLKS